MYFLFPFTDDQRVNIKTFCSQNQFEKGIMYYIEHKKVKFVVVNYENKLIVNTFENPLVSIKNYLQDQFNSNNMLHFQIFKIN